MSIRSTIFEVMHQIADEQNILLPPLRDDMSLPDTGFDSLAFAILVARLEDDLGSDPLAADEAELGLQFLRPRPLAGAELSAIAAGRPVAKTMRLDKCHIGPRLCQMRRRRKAGEATPDDSDIGAGVDPVRIGAMRLENRAFQSLSGFLRGLHRCDRH